MLGAVFLPWASVGDDDSLAGRAVEGCCRGSVAEAMALGKEVDVGAAVVQGAGPNNAAFDDGERDMGPARRRPPLSPPPRPFR